MTTEKKQFYSDALFYNQLQNILDFCQKNTGNNQVLSQYFLSILFRWNNIVHAQARHTNF